MVELNGFLSTIATGAVRSVLNNIMRSIKMGHLVTAIQQDLSLWQELSGSILEQWNKVPVGMRSQALEYISAIEQKYGGFAPLVLEWLREDQPIHYSVIINSAGGREWLERQVTDILEGLGLHGR